MGRYIKATVDSMEDFALGGKPLRTSKERTRAKRSRSTSKAKIAQSMERISERVATKDWDRMAAEDLVSLFCYGFNLVYGIPADLPPKEWSKAMMHAGKLVGAQFGGDYQKATGFLMWYWRREKGREQWRKEQIAADPDAIVGKPTTWQGIFIYRNGLMDYRVHNARAQGHG